MSPWVRRYSLTHHFTHKLMANQNGQYRPPKICYILGCQTSKYSLMNTCHFTNSHTIIAATRASEWHLLKHCMAEDTGLQFVVGVLSFRGPTIVGETSDKIGLIHERLKVARSRQKSNPDTHRRELQFQEGDKVFLKVSPVRGTLRFGKKGKLARRFIGL